jgi:hypothetical protein
VNEQKQADESRARGTADESSRSLEETNDEYWEVFKETREHHDASFLTAGGVIKVAKQNCEEDHEDETGTPVTKNRKKTDPT